MLRLDRALTLYCVQPLRRVIGGTVSDCLPILMYHSVSESAEGDVPSYYRTATSPQVFGEHMALLKAEGYRAVNLKVGLERLQTGASAKEKFVVLTFDDGFRDFFTTAFPILQQHGLSATVFLPTAFIGVERRQFKARDCMTWREVRESRKFGIEFGSHTVNHPQLYELDGAQIRAELEQSRAVIEHELGEPIRSFAYPYAFPSGDRRFVARLEELLRATQYQCCVTTRIGRVCANDQLFTLPRLPMNSADDRSLFLAKLQGAYDWLTIVQQSFKRFSYLTARRTSSTVGNVDDSSRQPAPLTPASPDS